MTEHRGTSFYNSCVKVPINPCSRQPTPSYERYPSKDNKRDSILNNKQTINFTKHDQVVNALEMESRPDIVDNFLEFLGSIPDYDQVHHLSNEQFKQKVYHLKQRQKFLLKNLQSTLAAYDNACASKFSVTKCNERLKNRAKNNSTDLTLSGVKCYLEESRCSSPVLLHPCKCNELPAEQNLLRNRCNVNDKKGETPCKEGLHLSSENYSIWDKLNSNDDMESDIDSIETKSLPASITKEWQPTVPKPFSFTVREEAEKYMTRTELDGGKHENITNKKSSPYRKRRVKPIPLTSKIPLYDKLLAEKEERSRMNREESAINLMSQVRPFRLECDRRAWRSLAKSSPEIRNKRVDSSTHFKAKPVPKNLFSTEVYDRMLEDEYYRQLQKRVRAAQLMRSSSLPPSMARRERVMSACSRLQNTVNSSNENIEHKNVSELSNNTSIPLEKCKSVMSFLPLRGNNLAAILRCQVSREKLERDISEKMEEKRKEQAAKNRESLIGRNPAWRALRSAARYEHERDLSIRCSRRRHEAREQAERHRAQMETMLDRVTQIPTLFERHSQRYKLSKAQQKVNSLKPSQRKKKRKERRQVSSCIDSYMDYENVAKCDSGSSTSSSPRSFLSTSQSSKASNTSVSHMSEKSATKSQIVRLKGKEDRSRLKVSINETAKLIGGRHEDDKLGGDKPLTFRDNEFNGRTLEICEHDTER